ncbi:primosomal protein N' [Pararhizobium sp. IMCC21322]|uniref:primosomal protein N' n=1 Tax=Pararhizobium sp. IMCC21322 TaxID=3067903 RepID=UPI0027423EA5|nr:primosomal protein N' [Pararhizobium sp. IMCC21322]
MDSTKTRQNEHPVSAAHIRNTIVDVLVPVAVDRPYSYKVPEGMALRPGALVVVPLGPREVTGVVWPASSEQVDVPSARLKSVLSVHDVAPLQDDLLDFIAWLSAYTLAPLGMVLRMVLRAPAALEPPKPMPGFRLGSIVPERLTPARQRVLDQLQEGFAWTKKGLAEAAGVGTSVVVGLEKLGALEKVLLPPQHTLLAPDTAYGVPELSDIQQQAADQLVASVDEGGFQPSLLEGITGSGKTEVYFEAVARVLDRGKQVLLLLPEISLTTSFLDRFTDRFGARPAEWHSDVSPKQRAQVWRGVADGTVRAVAGARSGLFLPFRELGLIVVDEEHEPAYKQEEGAIYHARDMAVVRAHRAGFPVILSSATPSVETLNNAQSGRYQHIKLNERYAAAELPDLSTIDMRVDGPERGHWLAPKLVGALRDTLAAGQQSLLFLNRRGYAPLTLCRKCGHRFQCESCSAWLVEHRFRGTLSCHHCGHTQKKPDACPECNSTDSLVPCGPGVERITEEVEALFPEARTLMLSSDMMGGVRRMKLELESVAKGDVDIVVGTQLVAKGHHFPLMRLVGVLDADLALGQGDPRAAERCFQLLAQVTGRAGRSGGKSAGLIQSYQPDHPVIDALVKGEPHLFYEREMAERKAGGLPPFGRLAGLIVSGEDKAAAATHAAALSRASPRAEGVRVLGPAEAPMALVRGRHRFRLLARAPRNFDLSRYLREWLNAAPKARGSVRVSVDIDPVSFF